jgi:RNA polymerase sigma-70 factor, ECF subfamily
MIVDAAPVEQELERRRAELTGFCRRMLGSPFEAEDAVQDTLVRAWLYRIATNVCLDELNGRERRPWPVDPGLPEGSWVAPAPDGMVVAEGDPAEAAARSETFRAALEAALRHLSPGQRAALILCEVLRWRASEVAVLLGTSVASVTSSLQRALARLAAAGRSRPPHENPLLAR